MTEHARLSASSAHRWMNCAGAPRMEAGLPEIDTEYTIEGTAAHELAKRALIVERDDRLDGVMRRGTALLTNTTEIKVHLKEGGVTYVPVTDEMRNAVWEYVTLVIETWEALPSPKRLYVETKVSLAQLNPPEPMFGTADAIIIGDGVLVIADFKFGVTPVEVPDNPQLMEYALAAMLTLPHEGKTMWADARFRTIIVQPRYPHPDGIVREWEYTYDQIRDFGHVVLDRAKRAHDPNAPLTPGPWCKWCKAAAFCPALYTHTQDATQEAFGAPVLRPEQLAVTVYEPPIPAVVVPDPATIPMEQVVKVLDKAELIEGFLAAVKDRVQRELREGRPVPGWKLVSGRAMREWVDPAAVERWAMQPGVPIQPEELFEKVLRSPAQVEKLVGKKNLPPDLWRKVSKSEKLVREADPRPALPTSAQNAFAALPPAANADQTDGGGTGDVD